MSDKDEKQPWKPDVSQILSVHQIKGCVVSRKMHLGRPVLSAEKKPLAILMQVAFFIGLRSISIAEFLARKTSQKQEMSAHRRAAQIGFESTSQVICYLPSLTGKSG